MMEMMTTLKNPPIIVGHAIACHFIEGGECGTQ